MEQKNKKPFVSVVIPNYNGCRFLAACLESVFSQGVDNLQVILVDNGSTDGSVSYVEEEFPQVELLFKTENLGFGAAINAGIKSSRSEYIFLLNNDTELSPDTIALLLRKAVACKEFSFFVPKMLDFKQRDTLDGAGDGYLRGGAGYRLGTGERDSSLYNREGEVFGACAGAVLYRKDLFDEVGLFDAEFFAYLEDVDLNLRTKWAGLSGCYVPEAVVYHIGSATSGSKINPFIIRLSTRNSFFVLLKNYPFLMFVRLLPVIAIYQFFWLLFVLRKGQLPAYCLGVFEAVRQSFYMRKKFSSLERKIGDEEFAMHLKKGEEAVIESIMNRRSSQGKGNFLFKLYKTVFL